ncbi:MAG: aminotransferase class IV [Clostridium sp.]|uniref:aminotransferase class IV n=1 Tax=Clostridium sp. TaxID=1506 RepID=UPI002FC7E227
MADIKLDYFIFNDNIYPSSEFENLYIEDAKSLYEVIRVCSSTPLFLEEHLNRLFKSANIVGYSLTLTLEEIRSNIKKIINKNNATDYNLKIVINNLDNPSPNVYYFFITTNYPDPSLYTKGVDAFLYSAERDNPNAKVINATLREKVNALMQEKNCFEAILVNNNGYITEGSRSNLFFIKDNTLYTTKGSDVLLGITRDRIISLAIKDGINVVEDDIHVDSLPSFSSIFISGTSPKALPIKNLDNMTFSPKEELMQRIIKLYDNEIDSYIKSHN